MAAAGPFTYGLQLQEQLSVFAANFVRSAAHRAREQVVVEGSRLQRALKETTTLVRLEGKTRARWLQGEGGSALVFDAQRPFGSSVLIFAAQVSYIDEMTAII